MRLFVGSSLRRTGFLCLLIGFISGLMTMKFVGDRRLGVDLINVHPMGQGEHLGETNSVQSFTPEHDHSHGASIEHQHQHSQLEGQQLPAIQRKGVGCSYSWTAVAHRHVIGGELDTKARSVGDCQAACVNRTDCNGVDFNNGRQCYLIVGKLSESGDHADHQGHVHAEEHEQGCVHYNLMRACGTAADDSTVADALSRDVRVLCWIMTTPENHMSKAVHIQATWGRRCNTLLFVSEKDDVGALSAVRVDVETGREHLTAKTMSAFQHIYEHHINDADWFLKADDDTYVIMENLRYFLSSHDPNEPVYFGHHFKVIVQPQGYPSGGAGYVLSKEALTRFAKQRKGLCHEDQGAEDVEMGDCMQKLGVRLGDSRDSLGRSRFHCFDPPTFIHGGYPDWYLSYDKYGAKKGTETISDYAISFHYINVEQLYNLEFYVYHLRPYGVISGLLDLNHETKVHRRPMTAVSDVDLNPEQGTRQLATNVLPTLPPTPRPTPMNDSVNRSTTLSARIKRRRVRRN